MALALMGPGGGNKIYKSLVPPMTSTSQNGYEISAYNNGDGSNVVNAFDGNCKVCNWLDWKSVGGTIFWSKSNGDMNVTVKFPQATVVSGVIAIGPNYNNNGMIAPKSLALQYSDNGSSYTDVGTMGGILSNVKGTATTTEEYVKNTVKNNTGHVYWRVQIYRSGEYATVNQIILY